MAVDLVQIRELSKKKADDNWNFRLFLKGECDLDSDEVDRQVFAATRRVWAGIDCKTCANCCRELQPSFSEAELDRLARRLGMDREQVIEKYLEKTDAFSENPWQTRTKPCPFLKDNLCSVYEDRPGDCSGYPYLDKPEFISGTMGMLERTSTCPIVYEVVESLKESTAFRRRQQRRRRGRRRW
jgi:hypothetical protein